MEIENLTFIYIHNPLTLYHRYNIRWYEAPLHIQRLILFFLQRGSKIFILYIGEMFAVSLEHFATVKDKL